MCSKGKRVERKGDEEKGYELQMALKEVLRAAKTALGRMIRVVPESTNAPYLP